MFQLGRRKIVVLYRIPWTEKLHLLKTCYLTQGSVLHLFGQRSRKAIHVHLYGMPAFGLYKQLMMVFVGKTIDFIFYRRTIARSYSVDNALKHRRTVEACAQYIMYALAGVCHIAVFLHCEWLCFCRERKLLWLLIARLRNHLTEIKRACIYTWRRTCFHTSRLKTVLYEALGDAVCCGFTCTSSAKLFQPYVHHSVQESTIGEHYTLRFDSNPQRSAYSYYFVFLYQKVVYHSLKEIKCRQTFQLQSPRFRKTHTVRLCTRTPHSRTLRLVEHFKLNSGFISDNPHIAPQGIYFAYYLPLGNTSHSRVTAHLGDML